LILGAGYMGVQIADQLSRYGVKVILYDISRKALDQAKVKLNSELVSFRDTLDCSIEDCDLVIETVTEMLKLKKKLFRDIEALVAIDTVLTTNSSLLLPSKISGKLKHKERFCGFHFYWPDKGANIVDIMPTKKTECSIAQQLYDFSKSVGFEPVFVNKENYGYLYNDIFSDITGKAITLLLRKIGTPEDIDKSFRINTGCDKGPFEMMDEVGLDTVLHITRNIARRKPKAYFGVHLLKRYVNAGKLGVKSGEGFYKYE
jgi:3-hydroxybutyryl-CoA dehydrogenase